KRLTPVEAGQALGNLRQLAALAPDDSLVSTTRGRLASALAATAADQGGQGDWGEADQTLRASIALLPESRQLLEALDHARTERRDHNGLARLEQVRRQQRAVAVLIAAPGFDEAWDGQLHEQLQSLESELPAKSPWLRDTRGRVAALYLQQAQALIEAQRFSEAGTMLERGRAFAELPDFAEAADALKAAQADFARQSERQARAARIAAL